MFWERLSGVITPGGDPVYICPNCHDKKSQHINGIETRKIMHECPNCGVKLKYEYEEKNRKTVIACNDNSISATLKVAIENNEELPEVKLPNDKVLQAIKLNLLHIKND